MAVQDVAQVPRWPSSSIGASSNKRVALVRWAAGWARDARGCRGCTGGGAGAPGLADRQLATSVTLGHLPGHPAEERIPPFVHVPQGSRSRPDGNVPGGRACGSFVGAGRAIQDAETPPAVLHRPPPAGPFGTCAGCPWGDGANPSMRCRSRAGAADLGGERHLKWAKLPGSAGHVYPLDALLIRQPARNLAQELAPDCVSFH